MVETSQKPLEEGGESLDLPQDLDPPHNGKGSTDSCKLLFTPPKYSSPH